MSSNTLARLSVELAANTASFQSDLGKAARVAEKELKGIEASAVKMAAALGASLLAGGSAVAVMARQSILAADEMAEMAEKVGLSTERLSAYNYIAKMSGADTAAVSEAFKRLNVSMYDASRGQGSAKAAFEALGAEIKGANGELKSNDSVMKEIADRFAQMEDGAAKTALAMDIFGRAGADLIPMLNQGSNGFKWLTEEARRMGLIVSDETAKAAGELNDNLDRLTLSTAGFGNEVMVKTLPALNSLSKSLLDENSAIRVSATLAAGAGVAYAAATVALNSKVIALRAATVAQTAFNTASKANPYALAAAGIGLLVAGIYQYNKTMPEAEKVTDQVSTAMARFELITKKANEAIEAQSRAASGMTITQVREKVEGVSSAIMHLEILHKRAAADFARGAVSAGLVGSYDQQLKQRKQQLEHLRVLLGGNEKSPVSVDVRGPKSVVPDSGYGGSGLPFDDVNRRNEAIAAEMDRAVRDRGHEAARLQFEEERRMAEEKMALIKQQQDATVSSVQVLIASFTTKHEAEIADYNFKKLQIEQAALLDTTIAGQKHVALEALESGHMVRMRVMADAEREAKRRDAMIAVNFASDALNVMVGRSKSAAKASRALSKALALQRITHDTPVAAMAAASAVAGIPYVGPALAIAAKASIYALGAAAAANVMSEGSSSGGGSSGGAASVGSVSSTGALASQQESKASREPEMVVQTTIVSIPENAIMTARQIADMLDEVYASGKMPQNLRVVLQ